MQKIKYILSAILGIVLYEAIPLFYYSELEMKAFVLSNSADNCLESMRIKGREYDMVFSCNSLGDKYMDYLEAGGSGNKPSRIELMEWQAMRSAWSAKAVYLAGNDPTIKIW